MANVKLSKSFIHGWEVSAMASKLKWCKHRTLGVYVHFLSATQAQLIERAHAEILMSAMGLSRPTAERYLEAMKAVHLLQPEPDHTLVIAHNKGIIARHERSVAVGKEGGLQSVASKKAARNASRRGRPPKTQPVKELQPQTQGLVPQEPDKAQTTLQRHCSVAWQSYHDAYLKTTRQAPVRNAKASSLIKAIVQQLGSEAPEVLQFFCSHPSRLYAAAIYPLNLALRDAQALRTQWRNQRYVTPDNVKQRVEDHAYQDRLRALDEMAR